MINEISREAMAEAKAKSKAAFAARAKAFIAGAKVYHAKMFEQIPVRYKKTWLDCFEGKATRNAAIRAKCLECVGYEAVQENVGDCTARTCPLWHFRPLQKSAAAKALKGVK